MTAHTQAAESPTVLIFGDSLSAGFGIDVDQSWAALLQQRLEEQGYEHRVVNASISGETTEGGATRIGSAIETFAPALIILELGGNDGLRGFPPARIKENLREIARTAKSSGADVVLLGIRIPTNYGTRYTQAFEAVYPEIAQELLDELETWKRDCVRVLGNETAAPELSPEKIEELRALGYTE